MDSGLFFHLEIEEISISEQELYAKSFPVNDLRENLPPHVENARRKPQTWYERLVTWPRAVRFAVNWERDPFNQNFRKFRSKPQWIGSVQPEKFRKHGSTFWGGPLFPVGSVGILVEWIAPLRSTTLKWRLLSGRRPSPMLDEVAGQDVASNAQERNTSVIVTRLWRLAVALPERNYRRRRETWKTVLWYVVPNLPPPSPGNGGSSKYDNQWHPRSDERVFVFLRALE